MTIDYYATARKIADSNSGGRPYFEPRRSIIVLETSERILMYGESPYSLAEELFNDQSLYWLICEVNEPRDPMSWRAGDRITLPSVVVQNSFDNKGYF